MTNNIQFAFPGIAEDSMKVESAATKPDVLKKLQFWPTERAAARAIIREVTSVFDLPYRLGAFPRVLDIGAGTGVWGDELIHEWSSWCVPYIAGVELYPRATPNLNYDTWSCYDCTKELHHFDFDVVGFNLPYDDSLEVLLEQAMNSLRPGGLSIQLVKLTALAGQSRNEGIFARHPYRAIFPIPERLSFTGDGKSGKGAEYAVLVFQKDWKPNSDYERIVKPIYWKHVRQEIEQEDA